jgi:glycosyltransferase involved in cell wall biosynthesis
MSRVDVIIPCYRYGHFLRGCVESVLGQDGVDVRVLVLDDASPDHTAEVGEALAREDRRVTFRRHAANRGHIATYNEGLEWATGDYILLLSADDLLTPGALGRAAAVLDAHPEVVLAYGSEIRTADPRPAEFVRPARFGWRVTPGPRFVEECCRECDNIVPTPTAVVRTAVQQRVGGYRADLPHSGDLEMWLRFGAHGAVAALDCEQAYYRVHGQNMSEAYWGIPDLVQVRAAFAALFDGPGKGLPGCDRLAALARRNVAGRFFWSGHRLFDRGDLAGCRRCLALALETWPPFRHRPEWSRFWCKRLFGRRVWSLVGPLVRRARGGRPALAA